MIADKHTFNELQRQKRLMNDVLALGILSLKGRMELISELRKVEVKIKMELDKNCGVIV